MTIEQCKVEVEHGDIVSVLRTLVEAFRDDKNWTLGQDVYYVIPRQYWDNLDDVPFPCYLKLG